MTIATNGRRALATKAQLQSALVEANQYVEGSADTIIELSERLADLEFALEDVGWRKLSGESSKEFSNAGLRRIIEFARYSFLKNPLINHAALVQANYVWGQGVSISALDPDVDEVIQSFLEDKKNASTFSGQQVQIMNEVMLQVEANIFIALFTNKSTGRVRVRVISTDEILAGDIITNPDDADEPWFYKRSFSRRELNLESGEYTTQPAVEYYPDWNYRPSNRPDTIGGNQVNWDTPVYHVKVGGLRGMRFGVPELYSSLDWAQAVRNDLEDYSTLRRALARFAFQVTAKGGKAGVAAVKKRLNSTLAETELGARETNPPPAAGSTFIGTEGYKLDPIRTAGAAPSPEEGRRLWLMVSAGTGIPETILAGNSDVGSYATAKTLDRPTELQMRNRQVLWTDIYKDVFLYVVEQAIVAMNGPLVGTVEFDEDGEIEIILENDEDTGEPKSVEVDIDFPSILERDSDTRVGAIIAAATLSGQTKAGTIPDKLLVRLLLQALGEPDIEEVLDELFPEDEEDLRDPVEDMSPGAADAKEDEDSASADDFATDDELSLPPTDEEAFTETWVMERLQEAEAVAKTTGKTVGPAMIFGKKNKKFVAKQGQTKPTIPAKPKLTPAERKARREKYLARVKEALVKLEKFTNTLKAKLQAGTASPNDKLKLEAYSARMTKYTKLLTAKPPVKAPRARTAKAKKRVGTATARTLALKATGLPEYELAAKELREALRGFLDARGKSHEGGASAGPFRSQPGIIYGGGGTPRSN